MAYDDITDAELDAESPVTESLMRKMRDNPIEIADAAAGAPRVRVAALETAQDRADSGTGLATAGMSPVATGGDGAEWDYPSAFGGTIDSQASGGSLTWQNLVPIVAGQGFKIDAVGLVTTGTAYPGAGNVYFFGLTSVVWADDTGEWAWHGAAETTGIPFFERDTVASDTRFRVSGGYVQFNLGGLTPLGATINACRIIFTYQRIGSN